MFSNKYLKACVFIVALQIMFLFLYQIVHYLPVDTFKKYLASDFMSEEEEEKMVEKQRKRIEDYESSMRKNNLKDNLLSQEQ